MEQTEFEPGCFGSAIFHRVDSLECSTCPIRSECELKVRERESIAISYVQRFDKRFGSDTSRTVIKWLADRWKEKITVRIDTKRFKDIFESWVGKDINPYQLNHNSNPVERSTDPVLFEVFSFIIEVKAFKVRDLQEHIQEIFPKISKLKASQYARLLCDTLIYLKIINKGSKGLLSL